MCHSEGAARPKNLGGGMGKEKETFNIQHPTSKGRRGVGESIGRDNTCHSEGAERSKNLGGGDGEEAFSVQTTEQRMKREERTENRIRILPTHPPNPPVSHPPNPASEPLNNLLTKLSDRFGDLCRGEVVGNALSIQCHRDQMVSLLYHVKHAEGFVILQLISCIDWEEENEFQLTYLLWNPQARVQLLLSCRIPRQGYEMASMIPLWPHAETFERELHEMFGLCFTGNARQDEEFLLENWDGPPPMLRSFDTRAFAMERFGERPGREHMDPREYVGERTGEWELSWPRKAK